MVKNIENKAKIVSPFFLLLVKISIVKKNILFLRISVRSNIKIFVLRLPKKICYL